MAMGSTGWFRSSRRSSFNAAPVSRSLCITRSRTSPSSSTARQRYMRLPPTLQTISSSWHLDEMVCKVGGNRMYLWRAVDDEGEVLDLVMQRERDTGAALKLLRRLLRNQPVEPIAIVTDGLTSYGSALRELDLRRLHHPGRLR